jgi:alanine dehydrogenase
MRVGTVRERKPQEHRVGLTPNGVESLAAEGHEVLIETAAGLGSGFTDEHYVAAGARILPDLAGVYAAADLIVKVKEPQPEEFEHLRPGLMLFTYLHLAAEPAVARALLETRTTGIAYETVVDVDGSLPLLIPMSQVAGRMAAEVGAHLLKKPGPGRGKLLGGVPGVAPARVVILGAGTVATNACRIAVGLGGDVVMIAPDYPRLRRIDDLFHGSVTTLSAVPSNIARAVSGADLVIAAVLVPGAKAPRLLTRALIRSMGEGAVYIDVSIDQGGASETSRPTTLENPTYIEEGVIHYCVANMPGAVPYTSTMALEATTLPYILGLAGKGLEQMVADDPGFAKGVNTYDGEVTLRPVAEALELPWRELPAALGT